MLWAGGIGLLAVCRADRRLLQRKRSLQCLRYLLLNLHLERLLHPRRHSHTSHCRCRSAGSCRCRLLVKMLGARALPGLCRWRIATWAWEGCRMIGFGALLLLR